MKVSIIVPVYNSKKYLRKCLNSLKSQTCKNLEFILVDDGSTDNSLEICKKYRKLDKRFKVFHKKNGGTSSARNYGIKKSTGDYITFVDNDDYIMNKNAFKNISKMLEKNDADVLLHSCIYFWEKKNKYNFPNNNFNLNIIKSKNKEEVLKYLISNGIFTYTVWDKIIKRSIVDDNNIKFSIGKRNEDSEFCIKLLEVCNSYDYFENPFYVYRKEHSYAQTSIIKYSHTKDLKDIIIYFVDKYNKNNDSIKPFILNYISYLYAVYLGQTLYIKDDRIKKDIEDMKNYQFLLKENMNKHVKLLSFFYKFFGFKNIQRLLYFYMKLKYNIRGENNG